LHSYGSTRERFNTNFDQKSDANITHKYSNGYYKGKNRINNKYILYSQKKNVVKTAYDAMNKSWTRNISTKKVKEPNKTNVNIVNNTVKKNFQKNDAQVFLMRPVLRQCPKGMVRDNNRGDCVHKFFDDDQYALVRPK